MSNVVATRLGTGNVVGRVHRVNKRNPRRTLCGWRVSLRMMPTHGPVNCKDCSRMLGNGAPS